MKRTATLIRNLYRPFSRDPEAAFVLTLNYDGVMTWTVADQVLTTAVTGGSGAGLTVPLGSHTMASLASALDAETGYTAALVDASLADVSAAALLDASNSPSASNGDHLFAFRAIGWGLIDTYATAIHDLYLGLTDMFVELYLHTARGGWLTEWAGQIIGRRRAGESDTALLERVRIEVASTYSNNRALEVLVQRLHGRSVMIEDIPHQASGRYAGLSTLAGGEYAYGDPANDNPLVCAMAVQFGSTTDCAAIKPVMASIARYRAAGTVAIAFANAGLLHTNAAGETVNNQIYVIGPATPTTTAIICP